MRAVAAIALVLVATACGAARTSMTTVGSSPASALVAFSRCMRSAGVRSFPDPRSDGVVPKESLQQLGVSSFRYETAQAGCRHLLPGGGGPPNQAQLQHVRETSLRFSRCVRAHGVANFPEPGSDGRIPDPASVGIDQGSPRFEAANTACARYRPPYMPSNAAYNAWARSHGQ